MCFDFIFKPNTDSSSDSNSYFEFNSESINQNSESQTENNLNKDSESQTETYSESNFASNFNSDFDDSDDIWSESSYNENNFYESSNSFDYNSESSMSYYQSENNNALSYNWYEFIISMSVIGGAFVCILISLALFGIGYKYKKRRDKNKINKFYAEMYKEENNTNKIDQDNLSIDEIPTIDEKNETIIERKNESINNKLNTEEELKKSIEESVAKNDENILPNFIQNDDNNMILPDMIEDEIKIHSENTNSYSLSSTSENSDEN